MGGGGPDLPTAERRCLYARIAVLPGDGIGPEIIQAAVRVLRAIEQHYGHTFAFEESAIGEIPLRAAGMPLPGQALAACRHADAVLLGPIGGSQRCQLRPDEGRRTLIRELGLHVHMRQVQPQPALFHLSPIKPHLLHDTDLLLVQPSTSASCAPSGHRDAVALAERVLRRACLLARSRSGLVAAVDGSGGTASLWRDVATRVTHEEFPDIGLEHWSADAMSRQLLARPSSMDVVVPAPACAEGLFGTASALIGSPAMVPSVLLSDCSLGVYEPTRSAAPGLAGCGVANPYGAIRCAILLLRHSLGLYREADHLEAATHHALARGVLTADLHGHHATAAGTHAVTAAVIQQLHAAAPRRPSMAHVSADPVPAVLMALPAARYPGSLDPATHMEQVGVAALAGTA